MLELSVNVVPFAAGQAGAGEAEVDAAVVGVDDDVEVPLPPDPDAVTMDALWLCEFAAVVTPLVVAWDVMLPSLVA